MPTRGEEWAQNAIQELGLPTDATELAAIVHHRDGELVNAMCPTMCESGVPKARVVNPDGTAYWAHDGIYCPASPMHELIEEM